MHVAYVVDDALGELALGLEGPGRAARFGDGILELRQHLGHVVGDGFLLAHRIQRHRTSSSSRTTASALRRTSSTASLRRSTSISFSSVAARAVPEPFEVRPGLADGRALIGDRGDVVVAPSGDLVN
jgi:hypothetical protein